MKNKFTQTVLVFVIVLFMIIQNAMANTLEKAKTTGKFTLAYRESSIPFSYLGEDGKPLGLDRKSTRLNSSHVSESRMPSSA